jgi:hypothetical protein
MSNIKCSVTECNYNQNVACRAPMIEVSRKQVSSAHMSDETKCETFKQK